MILCCLHTKAKIAMIVFLTFCMHQSKFTDNSICFFCHKLFVNFIILCSVIAANGGVEADVHHRVNEGCKVLSALKGVMKNRGLGMNVKKVLYEKVAVPTVMYGSESWV